MAISKENSVVVKAIHKESDRVPVALGRGLILNRLQQEALLVLDGWRQGPRDGLWRNDRFGGSYKTKNTLRRIGSRRGETTQSLPSDNQRKTMCAGERAVREADLDAVLLALLNLGLNESEAASILEQVELLIP